MLAAQTIFQEKKSNNALRDERARGQIARRTGDELMVYRNLTLYILTSDLTSGWIVHQKPPFDGSIRDLQGTFRQLNGLCVFLIEQSQDFHENVSEIKLPLL